MPFPVLSERFNRKLRLVPGFRKGRGYRLLAITGEIVDTRVLAIFFFGSPTFNLIVSVLVTEPALNLKQKAERL